MALWVGSGVSNLGDGMRIAALPLLAAQLTDSPLLVAAVTSAQFLPWLTFAPVGGALVDRWRRRETILVTQLWRGAVMAALAVIVAVDWAAIWHVYVVAALITVGEILVDPAVGALVPTMVQDDQLDAANARIFGTEVATNEFAGAPLGSFLFTVAPWLPFVMDAVSYASSTAVFGLVPPTTAADPSARAGLKAEVFEGVRWLAGHPLLGPFTLVMALFNFGAVAGFALFVLLVTDVLGASELVYGAGLALLALGGIASSMVASRLARVVGRFRLLVLASIMGPVFLGLAAAAPNVPVLLVAWFFVGTPAGLVMPVGRALQQRLTPNHLLGRVSTASRFLTRGSMVVGSLISGLVAALTSVRWGIGFGAGVELVAGGLLAVVLRGHDLDGSGAAAEPAAT
ncbi:MAG: MFS transporter [Actinomycetia bacterium]|nr:MFS transporter [Actinomycetes bacterium]